MWCRILVTPDEQNPFALLGHHVAEVRERKGFADAAFAIDRNDLGLFGRFALGHFQCGFFGRFVTQAVVEFLQVRYIKGHSSAPN